MTKWEPKKKIDEEKKVADKQEYNMSYIEGARRGQAFGLAVADAIKNDFQDDKKEIFSRFVYYYELGKLAQTYSMEEIKGIIE